MAAMNTSHDADPAAAAISECPHLAARFSPLVGEQVEDPYSFFAEARNKEPVFFSPQFQMWFVTRYDDIDAILSDPATFSSRGTIPVYSDFGQEVRSAMDGYRQPQNLINMDPPEHTRLRRLVQQAFSPRRVAALADTVREITVGIVAGFATDAHADLVAQLAYPLPLAVIFRVLGVPAQDIPACQRWTADLKALQFGHSGLPADRLAECARSVLAFQLYLEELAGSWTPGQRDGILGHLLQAQDEDGTSSLSLFQVADQMNALVIGGHETLASGLGNILHLLLSEPERWRRVCADPGLIEAAVEEGLRVEAPVNGMIRITTRPVTVGGVALPAQARLLVLFGSANRDQSRFPQADQYLLNRAGQPPHLAFGRGIHYCVGAPLARLEARIALEVLGQRLPGLRLAPGPAPQHVPNLMFRGLARLPVIWNA
jgi:cytochrome P450